MPPPRLRAPQGARLPGALTPETPELGDDALVSEALVEGLDAFGLVARGVELKRSRLRACDLSGARLAWLTVADCELERCNLANLAGRDAGLHRVRFTDCRLTGLAWTEGAIEDAVFRGCQLGLASFGGARLQRVAFEDCVLTDADFQASELRSVRFERCDLSGAGFAGTRCSATELRGCTLDGLRNVEGLRGAALPWPDLVGLTGALAAALGLRVLDDRDQERPSA